MSTDIPSNIALITGPYVLGGVFSYGLFGILIVQIFFYQYTFCEQDPVLIRAFVYTLAFFDLALTVMQTNFMWQILAQHWGDSTALNDAAAGATAAIPFLSGIVASLAHAFYAWRIYRLTSSKFIPILIMSVSLITCAMSGYCGIHGAQISLTHFSEMNPEVSTWLGGSTLCDFLITIVLVLKYKKHSTSAHMRNTLLRLITLTVETGFVTAVTALVELMLFIFNGNSTLFFIPLFMLSKMYSNCLLANLNTRGVINTQTGSGNKHPLWVDLDTTGVTPQVHVGGTTVRQDCDVELVVLPDSGQDGIYRRNSSPDAVKTSAIDMYTESETSHAE
ncbi:hypothetical protein F5880DRAFT_1609904 [Lentinula raphanica]|nr:hypothetical protein F5880DRAFT_1609904 [Lentinula raphanica]